ncbi:MAG: CHAT domain-containing protein [Bacteroidota bacterium]
MSQPNITRNLIILLLLSFGLQFNLHGQSSNQEKLGEYYRKIGWATYKKGLLDSALVLFSEARAQGPSDKEFIDMVNAERFYIRADQSKKKRNFDDALSFVNSTLDLTKDRGKSSDTLYAHAQSLMGGIYTQKNQAKIADSLFAKAEELYGELDMLESESMAVVKTNLGLNKYFMGELDKAEEIFKESLAIFQKLDGDYGEEMASICMNMSGIYFNKANMAAAADILEDGLFYIDQSEVDYPIIEGGMYYNLAATMVKLRDFDGASRYGEKAYEIWKAIDDPRQHKVAALNGIIYSYIGQFDQALDFTQHYYRHAVKQFGPGNDNIAAVLGNLSNIYLSIGDTKNAALYNQKAWDTFDESLDIPFFVEINLIKTDALISAKNGDLEAMREQIERAYQRSRETNTASPGAFAEFHASLSTILYAEGFFEDAQVYGLEYYKAKGTKEGLGNFYLINALLAQDKLAEAEESLNAAFEAMAMDVDLENSILTSNRPNSSFNQHTIQTLSLAGRFYFKKALQNQSEADFLKSYHAFELAANVIDTLRDKNQRFETQTELLKDKHRVYEKLLESLWELYKISPDPKWAEKALEFAEKSKGILISESLKANDAMRFSGIPVALQREEQKLRKKISHLLSQIRIAEEEGNPQLLAKVKDWNQELLMLNERHSELVSELRSSYPDYFKARYQASETSIKELQKNLRSDEVLVEYFLGDSACFAMVVDQRDVRFLRLADPQLWEGKLFQLQKSLYEAIRDEETGSAYSYEELSHELYQTLWGPLEQFDLPEKVLIIPDGSMGYLSFDILLKNPPAKLGAYKSYEYLIRDHQVRYAYSANMLQLKRRGSRSTSMEKFIAFAPSYPTGDKQIATRLRSDLADLPFAQEEAKMAFNIMGGKMLQGVEASEANFKNLAERFRVIHIAAHAQVDDSHPLYSRIFFTPSIEDKEDQKLEVMELFNMELGADLIVLSACETGIGEVKEGEGMVSLAWGASYAGSKSVLTSLWQVIDMATAKLISSFYESLNEGYDKDEALRKAKIQYLENADNITAHPFYWGGFILIGDHKPISSNGYLWWIGGGVVLLGLFGIGLWRRRRAVA